MRLNFSIVQTPSEAGIVYSPRGIVGLSAMRTTMSRMAMRADTLIDQIEQEALDATASLADALRKCMILGGKAGSEQLRDWATRELEGYFGDGDKLPKYRVVGAQIQIDAATSQGLIQQQPFPPSSLPDFVRENVSEQYELRDGVGSIEALIAGAEARNESVKISLPMGNDIARVMNHEHGDPSQQILSVYWALATPTVWGVLDQIRTALTKLVAELRATMPAGQAVPSEAAADQAVQVVVSGKRSQANVTITQASGVGSATTTTTNPVPAQEPDGWSRGRKIGTGLVGVATIAGAVFAAVQAF